ncbi:ATP-binding protein [Lewinella sp. W8]|uniref:ATP-binding protein n=1 Tax=Lewinella sp. W8 TaxID=2528208 RepID=UPI0010672869|nr:ATP-binding protein [Lewinella sp. W8]MTB50961.1 hypothetical protein [Lewinella sp. W8]
MNFLLYSLKPEYESTVCYFRMDSQLASVYSPFYADRAAALAAMRGLILRFRSSNDSVESVLEEEEDQWLIQLFNGQAPAVGNGLLVESEELAAKIYGDWEHDAKADTFPVAFWESAEDIPEDGSLKDLDLSVSDDQYAWEAAGSTVLTFEKKKGGLFGELPNLGLQANPIRKPCEPVFNALSPFVSADLPFYHGRQTEVDEIYDLLHHKSVLLLYGDDRVGKTSLLQCGLANRLESDAERLIMVRREEESLLTALSHQLGRILAEEYGEEVSGAEDPVTLARHLELLDDTLTFLVFDQLELLFSEDITHEERTATFRFVRDLVAPEKNRFRVVLSVRESFLAAAADYEDQLPVLLENRFRLLPLKQNSMVDASVNLLDILNLRGLLAVDDSEGLAERICAELADENGNVPAHCLQIYLHQLHQKSCGETTPGNPVPLNQEVVDKFGPATMLIDEYYTEKLEVLEARKREDDDGPVNPVLAKELNELKTGRTDCGCEEKKNQKAVAAAAVAPVPAPMVPWWLTGLFIVTPLALFGYWWMNQNGSESPSVSACEITLAAGNCEAFLDYLCIYGEEGVCTAAFRDSMDAQNCAIWRDYKLLRRSQNCASYEAFYRKYRDSGACMDDVRASLVDWGCALVRDTVQLTVRDTIIQEKPVPSTYGSPPATPAPGPDGPPCQTFGTTNFKRIGPLWVMTDALAGGPYRWEDALDACVMRGWRLPCVGEIDFLIEKIYRDDPQRAYAMLTGTSDCYLVNPAEAPSGKIEFWTATEANDANAWTYVFDVQAKTIDRESATPKSARLPCLCVQKDPVQQGSGVPPCYQKRVDRRPGK